MVNSSSAAASSKLISVREDKEAKIADGGAAGEGDGHNRGIVYSNLQLADNIPKMKFTVKR